MGHKLTEFFVLILERLDVSPKFKDLGFVRNGHCLHILQGK